MADWFAQRSARPMLIGASAAPYDDENSLFELKLDGERCLLYLDQSGTTVVNRRGRDITPLLPELAGLHRQVNTRCVLDGEVICGVGGTADFDAVRSRLARRSSAQAAADARRHPASVVVFDVLYHGDAPVTERPLEQRKALLAAAVAEGGPLAVARTVEQSGQAFFHLAMQAGMEGVIGKEKDSLYLPGRRTRHWVKVKHQQEDDFVICGYFASRHVAMLVLGQYTAAGQLVYKGRTTLGLRTADFARVRQVPVAAGPPFGGVPPAAVRAVVWLQPRLVCTVAFLRRQASGGLRQPHYRHLRPDKPARQALAPSDAQPEWGPMPGAQ